MRDRSIVKKIIFIMLALLVGIGGSFFYSNLLKEKPWSMNFHSNVKKRINFDKWISFNPKGESFSVSFPLKPTMIKRDLPIPGSNDCLNFHEYQCSTKEGRTYSVSYTILPKSLLKWGDSLVLNGALKLIMRELGKVELVGKDSNTLKNFPSLDYEHYTKENETSGTLVLVGKTLYKIEVTYPLNDREGVLDELSHFVESFEPMIEEEVLPISKNKTTISP